MKDEATIYTYSRRYKKCKLRSNLLFLYRERSGDGRRGMKRKKAEVLRGMMAASQSDVWTCRVDGVVVEVSGWRRVERPTRAFVHFSCSVALSVDLKCQMLMSACRVELRLPQVIR